jgi:hypothetical protein
MHDRKRYVGVESPPSARDAHDSALRTLLALCFAGVLLVLPAAAQGVGKLHVYEKVELVFSSAGSYLNPYTDVEVWVDLKGPNFSKRCYGFWDGGRTSRVRLTTLAPGTWSWVSGSNPPDSAAQCHIQGRVVRSAHRRLEQGRRWDARLRCSRPDRVARVSGNYG